MLLDLNLELILNYLIISHLLGPIWYDFHILIFWPPMLLFDHKCGRGIILFLENLNFDKLMVISVKKNASDSSVRQYVFKKLYKPDKSTKQSFYLN